MTPPLKPLDVVRYRPENRHCHEGMAIAYRVRGDDCDEVWLLETYWATTPERVRPDDYEVLFNLGDYEQRRGDEWERYAPGDRQVITNQHGVNRSFYVRKGAEEHLPTQIENARNRVVKAEEEVRSAQRHLAARREDLILLKARAGGVS